MGFGWGDVRSVSSIDSRTKPVLVKGDWLYEGAWQRWDGERFGVGGGYLVCFRRRAFGEEKRERMR